MANKFDRRIAEPNWLNDAIPRVASAFRLYREDKIPECIEAYMLSVPIKHALRGIYGGSNLKVAWLLLLEAIYDRVESWYWHLRFRLGLEKEAEDDVEQDECNRGADAGG